MQAGLVYPPMGRLISAQGVFTEISKHFEPMGCSHLPSQILNLYLRLGGNCWCETLFHILKITPYPTTRFYEHRYKFCPCRKYPELDEDRKKNLSKYRFLLTLLFYKLNLYQIEELTLQKGWSKCIPRAQMLTYSSLPPPTFKWKH